MNRPADQDSRSLVLERIRTALDRNPPPGRSREAVDLRLARPPHHPFPTLGTDDRAGRLRAKLTAKGVTVDRVRGLAQVPQAVRKYLDDFSLPRRACVSGASGLPALDWKSELIELGLDLEGLTGDPAGITQGFCGIAESGTVVVLSAKKTPSSLSFVPTTHIILLDEARIVETPENVWELLRREQRALPRAIHFISGTCCTGDIAMAFVKGPHGPLREHLILIESLKD